ncbi:alpha/beta hydrolase [Seohaeicola nanhaiensis]|uniref:Alpha/beta hydrolase n=1 Tax=Seohaeicola nanhaiensis TaxID=1387282 RepID=A0ABV9KI95_9RHOB
MLKRWMCALTVALMAALPAGLTAQEDPGLIGLAYLAETDPPAALDRIDALLAQEEASPDPDIRLVFDLYRLGADLLIGQGRGAEAAGVLLQLGRYAAGNRAVLNVDPARLFDEAARLYQAAGDPASAVTALTALVEEQRSGARPGAVIAETLNRLATMAEQAGDTAAATRHRAAASAALEPLTAGARGSEEGFREVEVYYATDRARTGEADPNEFYGPGRGTLELGVATVSVPETHTPGLVEAPSIWRLEFRADPAKHVVLQSVEPMEPAGFWRRLSTEFTHTPEKEAFVFVHGYNVTFDAAARRAAQIAYDMNFAGIPILYSWPSRGTTVGYVADTAVVQLSGRRLTHFLDDLVAKSGAETIHLVAHSMGNRALTEALELMALRQGSKPGDPPVFGQILFAAPDVDAGLFKEILPTIRPLAKRMTLYASEEDWALTASRKLHGDMPRAGIGGKTTLTSSQIDSIDMSELGEDMLAHSYFADDSSALADMMTLFWTNNAPQNRCGLFADSPGASPVWTYRRGICSDRSLISVLGNLQRENVHSAQQARIVLQRTVSDAEVVKKLAPVVEAIVSQ